jgi:hypothetical protein
MGEAIVTNVLRYTAKSYVLLLTRLIDIKYVALDRVEWSHIHELDLTS